jgi:Transposase DDE domain
VLSSNITFSLTFPFIDRRHQTKVHFTREHFRYEPKENAYYCPEGKSLRYRGQSRRSQGFIYCATEAQCQGCQQEKLCTPGRYRKLFVHWQEPARQVARALAGTPAYKHSQRARHKVEALFAELKQQIKLRRVRLRRLWNVAEPVSPRGHGPESEKVGAVPGSKAIARTQHDLTVSETRSGS